MIDIVSRDLLKSLMDRRGDRLITITLPTNRRSNAMDQDRIRLDNMLIQAREELGRLGHLGRGDGVLAEAMRLPGSRGFMENLGDSLALFIDSESTLALRLPIPARERVVIADRFEVAPLIRLLARTGASTMTGRYLVLALGRRELHLYQGTARNLDEVDLDGVPQGWAELMTTEDFIDAFPQTVPDSDRNDLRALLFYRGMGLPESARKRMGKLLQEADRIASELLAGERATLVLAGVPDFMAQARRFMRSFDILGRELPGDTDQLSPAELHAQAWEVVEPAARARLEHDITLYRQYAGTGATMADARDVVAAAHAGMVGILFVRTGDRLPGTFDPETFVVETRSEPVAGDTDLVDLAACRVLAAGGEVVFLEPDHMVEDSPLAAILRFRFSPGDLPTPFQGER